MSANQLPTGRDGNPIRRYHAACTEDPKGMYNGSVQLVSVMHFLQKNPRRCLETEAASSREATGKARGPRLRHRLQQRCRKTCLADPVSLPFLVRSHRCPHLPQPADERSVASCLRA
ncbi:hypothetical protein E2562_003321 [Oryza meyeriana var. granulata]|uniref:Uncharacterized protein n=1 Tax=Oryza meyeriana var. granulata TaxID=110450 RepID=A0A6G1EEA7_9ORYZ|nr:hypothetical protein E2562_003321 [Oryza meyeriana var. granulata]